MPRAAANKKTKKKAAPTKKAAAKLIAAKTKKMPRVGDLPREIAKLESRIASDQIELARLRRSGPRPVVENWKLKDTGGDVDLAGLFGAKRDLILVHNMGARCPYCTCWADGFNGALAHLESRAAFVVESPDDPAAQVALARQRGWRFRMVSSKGSGFKEAMGVAQGDMLTPAVSTFVKEPDGTIRRVAQATFGPGDPYCGVFHLFDLLADGAGEWGPRTSY